MTTTRKQASIERRNQIIDAALEVFSKKGFLEATNRDIARAAGIGSAGLIYHYFEDKRDLFRAVIQERTPVLELTSQPTDLLFEQPPEQVLAFFAAAVLDVTANPTTLALIRLVFGEALRQPEVAELMWEAGSSHMIGFLYRYFERLMERGVIRRIDLGCAVRSFMGPLFAYIVTTRILELPDERAPTPEELVQTTVDVFLHGALVKP
ncbi:TetR/AcrR family transcriptional regulator [Chloroflexi bacterium TSY]|nr:TetR/AcrR family transcriptional regulator [Chloroflexi bacterium TSY]